MRSNTGLPTQVRQVAPVLADQLHETLDALASADLTGLSADEHSRLVCRLVDAQSRLLAVTADAVAAFDTADVATTSRHRTTRRWLEHHTRLSGGAASHLTTLARALRDHLPATRDALADASITPQHATAIVTTVRTVGPEHAETAEPILLTLAQQGDPATVRRATADLFAHVDPEGAEERLQAAYEKRGLTLSVTGDHGYLNGVFDVESAELLTSALLPLMTPAGTDDPRTAAQRRADALLDITQKHLDTQEMPTLGGHRPHLNVVVDAAQLPPSPGSSSNDRERPIGGAGQPRGWRGSVTLPWTGAAVPASVARRWACDAAVTPIIARLLSRPRHTAQPVGPDGTPIILGDDRWHPLSVGRTQRIATRAQIKALTVRDGGCIYPGCSRSTVYCQAHHVVHWADGGTTDLGNLVLLCHHHHRTLHQGWWAIHTDPGSPGAFWTTSRAGLRPAQTAGDRSPPLRPAA